MCLKKKNGVVIFGQFFIKLITVDHRIIFGVTLLSFTFLILMSLIFTEYKTLPVALRTHNDEDHTFFDFCNFNCKFCINSYSSKDQKVSSISSKLCTRFAEPKFQLSIWRLWKYWWSTTNSWRPCIQLWFRI